TRAAAEAEAALAGAQDALTEVENAVAALRGQLDGVSEEAHHLEVERTAAAGHRRSIVERIETEWKQPFEQLMATAQLLELDRETLEGEAARIAEALEAIGPVNPLAVEEHSEE